MNNNGTLLQHLKALAILLMGFGMGACGILGRQSSLTALPEQNYEYFIGPGDSLSIFVWRNPDVSANNIPVRPDGRISSPLVGDIVASGKTAKQLAKEIEQVLGTYIKEPSVTVTVTKFVGGFGQQVRVVGQAVKPRALPYLKDMTLLDVMIQVGGLTPYADGNRAKLIRRIKNEEVETRARLEDLINKGDMSANLDIYPGDVIIIPEAWF